MRFERDVELLSDTINTDTAPTKPNTATYKSSFFIDCVYRINKTYRVTGKKRYFKNINFIVKYLYMMTKQYESVDIRYTETKNS
jgi:hypothetical protein